MAVVHIGLVVLLLSEDKTDKKVCMVMTGFWRGCFFICKRISTLSCQSAFIC